MNRRSFLTLGTGAVLGSSLASLPAWAQQGGYQLIDPPLRTADESKVEVLEYFWFGCPHCYAFEPTINKWKANKPEHVNFIREAPPLNPSWLPHSQAFYAAEVMGVTDKVFEPIFDAIHKEKRALRSPKALAKFVGELGVDSEQFQKTMNSFAVDARIRQSMQKARASGITGVPTIVIAGKYVTSNSLAGGHEGIISVIDRMVAEEHNAS